MCNSLSEIASHCTINNSVSDNPCSRLRTRSLVDGGMLNFCARFLVLIFQRYNGHVFSVKHALPITAE